MEVYRCFCFIIVSLLLATELLSDNAREIRRAISEEAYPDTAT